MLLLQLAQTAVSADSLKTTWEAWKSVAELGGLLILLTYVVLNAINKQNDLSGENETKRANSSESLVKTLEKELEYEKETAVEAMSERDEWKKKFDQLSEVKINELLDYWRQKKDCESMIEEKDLEIKFLKQQNDRLIEKQIPR